MATSDDYVSPSLLGTSFTTGTENINVNDLRTRLANVNASNKKFTEFNRFRITEGEDYSVGGISYVFFTKPRLYLKGNNLQMNSFLHNIQQGTLGDTGKRIINSLDKNPDEGSKFISLITNSVKNFETKDTIIKTDELFENYIGYKMVLPSFSTESQTVDTISIDYTEYADMSLTMLHKTWVEYMHDVKRGLVYSHPDYRLNKVVDYLSSIYYFKLGEDGKKIKYWAKYTGVFPTNIPYSAFSYHHGEPGLKQLSIQYSYSFKEDMDYDILFDFARLTGGVVSDKQYEKSMKGKVPTLRENWNGHVQLSHDFQKLLFF